MHTKVAKFDTTKYTSMILDKYRVIIISYAYWCRYIDVLSKHYFSEG